MSYHCVNTIVPPTVPNGCDAGEFTTQGAHNLVVACTTVLKLFDVDADGSATSVLEQNLYGRAEFVKFIRPKGKLSLDVLLVVFEDQTAVTLQWDADANRMMTLSKVDLAEPVGCPADIMHYGVVDSASSCLVSSLIQGQLKVTRIRKNGTLEQPFSVRIEESCVEDLTFVDPDVFGAKKGEPTLCALYSDAAGMLHTRTYSLRQRTLVEGSFHQKNVEKTARRVAPGPGGVLVFGSQLIAFISPTISKTIQISDYSSTDNGTAADIAAEAPCNLSALCALDATNVNHLLANEEGKLYGLTVTVTHEPVAASADADVDAEETKVSLKLEALGYTSIARCIAWLGVSGLAYIGSDSGESTLLQMTSGGQQNADGAFFTVIDTHPNYGPIADFTLVDSSVGGSLMVTCSGQRRDSSMRTFRNGVAVTRIASVPLSGVQGTWSLKPTAGSTEQQAVVLSFVASTKVLEILEDEIAETDVAGFQCDVPTLACGNTRDAASGKECWVQVTGGSVNVVDAVTRKRVASVACSAAGLHYTRAALHGSQVLCAAGSHLYLYTLRGGALVKSCEGKVDTDVACLAFMPEEEAAAATDVVMAGDADAAPAPARYCAVGLWSSNRVLVLALTDGLGSAATVVASAEGTLGALPRSLLLHAFADEHEEPGTKGAASAPPATSASLLCGLGDGSLVMWDVVRAPCAGAKAGKDNSEAAEKVTLQNSKRIKVGTRPVSAVEVAGLTGKGTVFLACDHPTMLYKRGGRVQATTVNLKSTTSVCAFNCRKVSDEGCTLALITDDELVIGTASGAQKVHTEAVSLPATPTCITYHAGSACFAIGLDYTTDAEAASSSIVFIQESGTTPVSTLELDQDELPMSCCTATFSDDPQEYIVVGTAFIDPEEEEVKNGRILVLKVAGGGMPTLSVVSQLTIKGACYQVAAMQGKLVAGVNSTVQVLKWADSGDGGKELVVDCTHGCHLVVVSLLVYNDNMIAVGDIFRSVTVFMYRAEDSSLEDIAHDNVARHVVATAVLDDGAILVSDDTCNLFTLSRNTADSDHRRLNLTSSYHHGSFVNTLKRGSLATPAQAGASKAAPTLLDLCRADATLSFAGCESHLFSTAQGSVGSVTTISADMYTFLDALQRAVLKVSCLASFLLSRAPCTHHPFSSVRPPPPHATTHHNTTAEHHNRRRPRLRPVAALLHRARKRHEAQRRTGRLRLHRRRRGRVASAHVACGTGKHPAGLCGGAGREGGGMPMFHVPLFPLCTHRTAHTHTHTHTGTAGRAG